MLPDGVIERTFPADFLDEITVVDTPGTNAIIREHEALTQRFVPRSDLVLFVTSADRPFTESEREFMAEIREWGKKIIVIINKIDLIRTEDDAARGRRLRRSENIQRLLGFTPGDLPGLGPAGPAGQGARRPQPGRARPPLGAEPLRARSSATSSRRSTRRAASASSCSARSASPSTWPTAT